MRQPFGVTPAAAYRPSHALQKQGQAGRRTSPHGELGLSVSRRGEPIARRIEHHTVDGPGEDLLDDG